MPVRRFPAWWARGLLLLLLLPAVAAAMPLPAMPANAPWRPELMGMVIRDPWYDFGTHPNYPDQPNYVAQEQMGALLADMGVRRVRLEFRVENEQLAGQNAREQIARNDYFIDVVAPRYNLEVLGLLSFGLVAERSPLDLRNNTEDDPMLLDPIYGGGVNSYMRTWLDRARLVADRYEGRIAAYEILNEQNRIPPNGDGIPALIASRLHTKFYRFVKHVDRTEGESWRDDMPIIIGGLHPAGTFDPGDEHYVSDRDYLRAYYASDGFLRYRETYGDWPVDGLGYHPYPLEIRAGLQSELDLIGSRMQEIRKILADELKDPLVPFWITEVGYNEGYPGQPLRNQALFMRELYRVLGPRPDVEAIFWFKYEDFPPAAGPGAQRWGVVHIPFAENSTCPGGACYVIDGKPDVLRASFWMYRELAGLPVERHYLPLVGSGR